MISSCSRLLRGRRPSCPRGPAIPPSIFTYAWQHTKRQQLWLLFVVVASMPFYFYSLDLPKRIINGPITGKGFEEQSATAPAFRIAFDLPGWLFGGGHYVLFDGFALDRIGTLVYLCLLFLALVLINGLFKLHISTFKGRLGERMLRRLRFSLVDIMLRFPIGHFKRVRASEVATMVKDEVEPIGGFVGDAYVLPAQLLTQALTALVFILIQSVPLGLVAVAVVGVQVILIPRMRRRLLVLGRQRQLTARQLAGRVGEVIESIESVRTNDASNWERAEIAGRLGRIFFIRFDIYQWKFLVKFLNNLLAQVTPFIFYLVGGYLAITGRLDIGQLVAVIAAYKDLPAPLKDLIDWDQIRADVQVKYQQLLEQFTVANLLDPTRHGLERGPTPPLGEPIEVSDLTLVDEGGTTILDAVSLSVGRDEAVALLGTPGSGGDFLAEAVVGLRPLASGRVTFGGQSLDALPESVTGRRIAYVGASTYLAQSSLVHSLTYGLRHAPAEGEAPDKARQRRVAEARASGNTEHEIEADWVDYAGACVDGPDALAARVREVLRVVDLEGDAYRLGLLARLPTGLSEKMTAALLVARTTFRERLSHAKAERYVERFDPDRYTLNATILENIVFGVLDPDAPQGSLAELRERVEALLEDRGLGDRLVAMGAGIARTLIELFGDLEPDNPLLQRLELMRADEIDTYRQILRRIPAGTDIPADPVDRRALLSLALDYVEPRLRFQLLDDDLQRDLLALRGAFRESLPEDVGALVHFHDPGVVNAGASFQDNVLFGRMVDTAPTAAAKVRAVLRETLEADGLTDLVIDLGLGSDIGSGGKRLSAAQAQKLVLARALLKRPDLLVVNRALTALDAASQHAIIESVLADHRATEGTGHATIWVLANPAHADLFDRQVAFEGGRIVGEGAEASAETDAAEPPQTADAAVDAEAVAADGRLTDGVSPPQDRRRALSDPETERAGNDGELSEVRA